MIRDFVVSMGLICIASALHHPERLATIARGPAARVMSELTTLVERVSRSNSTDTPESPPAPSPEVIVASTPDREPVRPSVPPQLFDAPPDVQCYPPPQYDEWTCPHRGCW